MHSVQTRLQIIYTFIDISSLFVLVGVTVLGHATSCVFLQVLK